MFIIRDFQNAGDVLTIDFLITLMVKRHPSHPPDTINSSLNRVESFQLENFTSVYV